MKRGIPTTFLVLLVLIGEADSSVSRSTSSNPLEPTSVSPALPEAESRTPESTSEGFATRGRRAVASYLQNKVHVHAHAPVPSDSVQTHTKDLVEAARRRGKALTTRGTAFVSQGTKTAYHKGSVALSVLKGYLTHGSRTEELRALASTYRAAGGLLGLCLGFILTGPPMLRWWTHSCLLERRPSCGAVLSATASIGFGLGRELGLATFYVLIHYTQRHHETMTGRRK